MRSVDIVEKHNEDWTYSEVTVFNKTENNNYQGGFAYKLNMSVYHYLANIQYLKIVGTEFNLGLYFELFYNLRICDIL